MGQRIEFEWGERIENTQLVYLEELPRINPLRRRALFRCDCGNTKEADLNYVRFLNITSCGCYRSELVTEKNTKHSHALRDQKSGAYRSWQAMHQRVKANPNYVNIKICKRWSGENGFANFFEDMGDRPEGLTIERQNNNKGYSPENCCWASRKQQAQNQRQTRLVNLSGKTLSINEWCRVKGILYSMVKERRQRGMSLEQALTTPVNKNKQRRKK